MIDTSFTVSQLRVLAGLVTSVTYNKSALKRELVNFVSQWYGSKDVLAEPVKSPKKLKILVSNQIKSWPIDAINVAYAQLNFKEAYDEWSCRNSFNGSWQIKTDTGCQFTIPQWYAQPAIMQGEMIQPIIDPHHILVNNRSRCCSKGVLGIGIKPDEWWGVAKDSKNNNTGLSIEIARELRDKQSTSFAQTTFSTDVEDVMISNGDLNEANWCALIRNWYRSIDCAGIMIDERISLMLSIRSFLLGYLNAGHFPPHGAYVSGLPLSQFEGILTNVDRRLQLYSMTKRNSYNQRAISSLDSETFFSGFQDYDPKGTGVLRADDIPIALGAATFLYKQRLDPNRQFYMRTSQRVRVYPENQIESKTLLQENEMADEYTDNRVIKVRSHYFDVESRKSNNPKRKSGRISEFGKPSKGAEGARSHYKFNEEKILPHRRFGLSDDDIVFT